MPSVLENHVYHNSQEVLIRLIIFDWNLNFILALKMYVFKNFNIIILLIIVVKITSIKYIEEIFYVFFFLIQIRNFQKLISLKQ